MEFSLSVLQDAISSKKIYFGINQLSLKQRMYNQGNFFLVSTRYGTVGGKPDCDQGKLFCSVSDTVSQREKKDYNQGKFLSFVRDAVLQKKTSLIPINLLQLDQSALIRPICFHQNNNQNQNQGFFLSGYYKIKSCRKKFLMLIIFCTYKYY